MRGLLHWLGRCTLRQKQDAPAVGFLVSRSLWRCARISPVQKRRVLHFIRENLDTDMAVSDLAACIGVSSAHFSRIFRASFGMSPYRFVMQERVAKAKAMLEESRKAIGEIAVELGFPSHSHFTKIFHKLTGATPGQFREGR